MGKVTIFEYHSHGAAPTLFGQGEERDESTVPIEEESSSSSDSRSLGIVGLLVLGLALALAGALYRWKNADSTEDLYGIESVEVTEYED